MFPSIPKKKSSASFSRRASLVLTAGLLFSTPALCAEDPYPGLIYDYEVASFCGLISKSVYDAYGLKRAALEIASGKNKEQLTTIRVEAMAEAELEYMNRGLGGFKPWCQNEGLKGVQRILSK